MSLGASLGVSLQLQVMIQANGIHLEALNSRVVPINDTTIFSFSLLFLCL